MSLVSPGGTTIQLIGPVTTTITSTNLITWNIGFIPCATLPVPDAGFASTWSNVQTWVSPSNYTGTYHPASGCLEDFSNGSANGLWQLIIEDHDQFQMGTLVSASLIFCNPAGLRCNSCAPNAGMLSPQSITLCESDVLQSSVVSIDFQGNVPPAEYGYQYILTNGISIVNAGASLSVSPPPGNYNLCGLSYLLSDAAAINALIAAGNYPQLVQAINDGVVCGDETSSCIPVNVISIPDTVFISHSLCPLESYLFRNQLFTTSGTYYVVEDGLNLCDSVFQLTLTSNNLQAIIAIPDSISCGGPGVLLDGSGSGGGNGMTTYEWTTTTGTIIGNPASSMIQATVPSIYTLTVRDPNCEVSADVEVEGDVTYPLIFLEGGILTCNNPTLNIHPIVIPTNVTYNWNGPFGFSSNLQNISVGVPGRYFLTVVSTAGCQVTAFADVLSDETGPDAIIVEFDRVCTSDAGVLGVNAAGMIYEWDGPAGPYPTNQAILVFSTGLFTVTVTDPDNGCSSVGSILYDPDFNEPSIIFVGVDSLRCNQPVNIFVDPTGIQPAPYWFGPNGILVVGFDVSLTIPGSYYVHVLGNNGCKRTDTLEIFASTNFPIAQPTNDTINCLNPVGTIGMNVPDADIYHWIGFTGPDSNNAFVNVTVPGTYYVTAFDVDSGCEVTAAAQLFSDMSPPVISYLTDTISCIEPLGELFFLPSPGVQYADIRWQFPDMTTSTGPNLNVSEAGVYLLSVTGLNGCVATSLIEVGADTIMPLFFLEADTLGCDLIGMIRTIPIDSLTAISWTGPNSFTSSDLNPMVSDTGNYFATGIGLNGCSTTIPIHVEADFEPPQSFLLVDTLGCITDSARFFVTSPDSIISFIWTDDMGTVLDTDSILVVTTPGIYYISLEGKNHCFRNDTIVLEPAFFPVITVIIDTLTCTDTLVSLIATANIPSPIFEWTDLAGNPLSVLDQLDVSDTGPFIISATADNGCASIDTILVPIDTMPPDAVISPIGEIRCQNRDFMLDGSGSIPAGLNYRWSVTGGNINSPTNLDIIDATDIGTYFLEVSRLDNGCTNVDSIVMMEHPDAITQAILQLSPPKCTGDTNAIIEILGLTGGVSPILFQLDTGVPQSGTSFAGLSAGSYLLQIVDAAGCQYDTLVVIDPTNLFVIDAGPDQEIFLGEPAILSGMSDILPNEILSQVWDSLGIPLCNDCPDFNVSPFETTSYTYTVSSITGCVKSDVLIIYVIEKGKFYIPNIFSPNDDQINDEVRLNMTPGIERVLRWIIFDRWGNAVYGKEDFDPMDPSVFWDGTMNGGETLNPAVFPYILELRLINGNVELHHGTITLIRQFCNILGQVKSEGKALRFYEESSLNPVKSGFIFHVSLISIFLIVI